MKIKKMLVFMSMMIMIGTLLFPKQIIAADQITATITDASVFVNEKQIPFTAYNINGSNYFKLRDLAYVLNGTGKQFSVVWDAEKNSITLEIGKAYTTSGGEMAISPDASKKLCVASTQNVYVGDEKVEVSGYNIGGNNYYKLRDILGSNVDNTYVDWNAETKAIHIDTSSAYQTSSPLMVQDSQTQASADEVYKSCADSVFYIKLYDRSGNLTASGSGFFLSKDGVAVTNYHVVKGAYSASIVTADGSSYNVKSVLGYDSNKDIAILQINGSGFSPVSLGDSDQITAGEKVYAIGSPYGLINSISEGIVAYPHRVLDDGLSYIQITAPVSEGSSGGALFNAQKEVIGITSSAYEDAENINFAVPIDEVKSVLAQLSITI